MHTKVGDLSCLGGSVGLLKEWDDVRIDLTDDKVVDIKQLR